MIKKALWLALLTLLSVTATSCGFKSDLYLPGQPQKLEQYDSDSLKDLGSEKLRQLQNQNDVPDTVTNSDSKAGIDAGSGAEFNIPDSGVVVELPSADDITRVNENLNAENPDNETREKADSRKKVSTEN